MPVIRPISQLTTTSARVINFVGWLAFLTVVSCAMFLLGLGAGAISTSISLIILAYLIVRRHILDINVDLEKKLLLVRYLPWFGKPKIASYQLSSLTEVSLIPANVEVPLLGGTRWTGRYKLVIKVPMWYELEFFTSDFSVTDLQTLHDSIYEVKQYLK
jgi:hypothetical protein